MKILSLLKNIAIKKLGLVIFAALIALGAVSVVANTQISLDSPATLPSDI